MTKKYLIFIGLIMFSSFAAAATDVWCPHVTAVGSWKTELDLYASGSAAAPYQVELFDTAGNAAGSPIQGTAAAKGWTKITHTQLNFEGTARITSSQNLLVKAVYQLGNSHAVCEFYLTGDTGTAWVLPNSVRSWMDWTGLALINPGNSSITVTLEAWKDEAKVAVDATVNVGAKSKFVNLSDGIWSGAHYADLDTIVIRSTAAIPAPISITGNDAGDRYLFFAAQGEPAAGSIQAGDLVATDSIVGNLRYVPAGTFTQGSPISEIGRWGAEYQFVHTLTKNLAVMETAMTRQMWADLKAAQSSLLADPSDTAFSTGMSFPVQNLTWYEAVLFANLLSAQQGLTQCYYTDAAFSSPITLANYQTDTVYCNWDAAGYRLPTEGEREYFTRAGTTDPFSIAEPNYGSGTCATCSPSPALTGLDSVTWCCLNSNNQLHPVGTKLANPWNLKDVHGNTQDWCWDIYNASRPTGSATDYRGAPTGNSRVLNGSAYNYQARLCRSATRTYSTPGTRSNYRGFRLVRSVQ